MTKLAIITVVYNNYSVLDDFFSSLKNQTNQSFTLFIADLSNEKKTINQEKTIIINGSNRGYAYGINLGLKKALSLGYNFFAVVNNDIYFKNNFVDLCLKILNKNKKTLIGGKIYYAPGFEYHKKYQKKDLGKVIWYAGGTIDWNNVITPHFGVDQVDQGKFDKKIEVDFITGCLMVFDKELIKKVGFFDEDYFLYYEDADYCVRTKKNHLKLIYDPNLVIWHKNAQSTQGSGSKLHQKYQERNRFRFGLKYAPLKTKIHLLKNYLKNKLFKTQP